MRKKDALVKSERSLEVPVRYVPIGGVLGIGDKRYRVVARPMTLPPKDSCSGCDLRKDYCVREACSSFDRSDGRFVWFKEIQNDEI